MENFNILIQIIDFMRAHYKNITDVVINNDIVEFKSNGVTTFLNPMSYDVSTLYELEETQEKTYIINKRE